MNRHFCNHNVFESRFVEFSSEGCYEILCSELRFDSIDRATRRDFDARNAAGKVRASDARNGATLEFYRRRDEARVYYILQAARGC